MLRPSMSRGRPALGCADRRAGVTAAMRSIVSSMCAGPMLQFTPTTSAPRRSSSGANCSGGVPSRLLPSSSIVICATMGKVEILRTAAMAAPISFRSRNVSRMNRSTPPATQRLAPARGKTPQPRRFGDSGIDPGDVEDLDTRLDRVLDQAAARRQVGQVVLVDQRRDDQQRLARDLGRDRVVLAAAPSRGCAGRRSPAWPRAPRRA